MRAMGLAIVCALGCAKSGALDTPIEDAPEWTDPSGKQALRLELGASMVVGGAPEGALAIVRALREEGQKGSEVDVLEARALEGLGLPDDAIVVLQDAAKRHPRSVSVHRTLGRLLADRKDLPGALSSFARATRLSKRDPELWNNYGFCLHASGRTEEAVAALRTSLRLDPTALQTRNNLGFALAAANRINEAWRVFKAGQGEASAHYNVGVAHELQGDLAAARERYAQALATEPTREDARAALARLDSSPSTPPPLETP